METNKKHSFNRFILFLFLFYMLGAVANAQHKSNTVFHAIVAKDGSGDFTTVQSAINAVPDNLDTPWLIFVKKRFV